MHSTVNVKSGRNRPPIAQVRKVLGDFPTFDRTSINAWEDIEFVQAVIIDDDPPRTMLKSKRIATPNTLIFRGGGDRND